jgi:hypothetical protein
MHSVEVRCNTEDLADLMSEMREWLDARRFEPDSFLDLLWKSGEFPVSNEELDDTATTVYEGI